MSFFVPSADTEDQAESIYAAIAKHVQATVKKDRIHALAWEHEGKEVTACVGKTLPECFATENEVVLAIFDCGDVFKICTPNRGAVSFDPVITSRLFVSYVRFF